MKQPTRIGLVEKVRINGREVLGRIDTGASISSVDAALAEELSLGPVVRTRSIRSANGTEERPVVQATFTLAGMTVSGLCSITDRSHMRYRVLVGRNMLKAFLIDPLKEGS